jgi:hypothetical protein
MFDFFTLVLIIIIIYLYLVYKPTASYRRVNYVDAEVQTLEFRISTPHPINTTQQEGATYSHHAGCSKSRRKKTIFRGHRN